MSIVAFAVLCTSSLLTIIDPIAAAPLFVAITAGQDARARHRTAVRACVVSGALLIGFAAGGAAIFGLFGITIEALRIAGGILFFAMAMPMLTGHGGPHVPGDTAADPSAGDDPAIVPLAMPIIAGPGAISTVMVLMGQARGAAEVAALHVAIVVSVGLTGCALWLAPALMRRLGPAGIGLVTRLLGLIMCVIGIQFVIDGARPIVIDVIRAARG